MKTDLLDIRHADCMDLMREFPDKHFDLAIVDPPYGIGVNHDMGRRKGDKRSEFKPAIWDSCSPDELYFAELFRVSKHQIIWGANHFISKMPNDSSCWLLWDKGFSEDVSFAQFELAWTSFNATCKKFDQSPNQAGRIHPTQKPVALYRWLLANYANAGDKILDTHLGSMSSVIACADMGFSITGCELDFDYYAAGIERVKRHLEQAVMFRNPIKLLVHDTIVMGF